MASFALTQVKSGFRCLHIFCILILFYYLSAASGPWWGEEKAGCRADEEEISKLDLPLPLCACTCM